MKSIILALLGLLFGAAGLGPVENVFIEFGSFVAGIAIFSQFAIIQLKATKFVKMLITWGTGIVFAFTGYALGLGFLVGAEIWEVAVYGVASALVANAIWPDVVKKVLEYLGLLNEKDN